MKLIFQEVKNFKSKFTRFVSNAKILEYVSLIKTIYVENNNA